MIGVKNGIIVGCITQVSFLNAESNSRFDSVIRVAGDNTEAGDDTCAWLFMSMCG
jgi:hypothetical protein